MAIRPVYYREGQPFNFSQNTYNPCCLVNAQQSIFTSFSNQLQSYANSPTANVNRAIEAIRGYPR